MVSNDAGVGPFDQVTVEVGLCRGHGPSARDARASLQLRHCEIAVPAVRGLYAGAVDGNQLAAVQVELPA